MIYHYFDNTHGVAAVLAGGADSDADTGDGDGHKRRLAAVDASSDAHEVDAAAGVCSNSVCTRAVVWSEGHSGRDAGVWERRRCVLELGMHESRRLE
jgi:hypothetical protein